MPKMLGALGPYALGAVQMRPGLYPGAYGGYGGGQGYGGYQPPYQQRFNRMMSAIYPDTPGVPGRDAAIIPMGFSPFIFALANGTNPITQVSNPQTPFRGQRLSTTVIRNGTSAATTAPLLSQLLVGQKPILTTSNAVALETFSAQAFDTNLLMPPTVPGVTYNAQVMLAAALTTTDTLLAFLTILGSGVL